MVHMQRKIALTLLVSKEENELIERLAERHGTPKSVVLRRAARELAEREFAHDSGHKRTAAAVSSGRTARSSQK